MYAGQVGIERRYRLRWRFDFVDRPTKRGIWNNSGGKQDEGFGSAAWCINKSTLVRAFIEAEDTATYEIKVAAEVLGEDFRNFSWIAATPMPAFAQGSFTAMGQVVGLSMVMRYDVVTCLVDGTTTVEPLSAADQNANLAGY